MVAYRGTLLPLTQLLKATVPDVHQQRYYADDAQAGDQFKRIQLYFEKLQKYGPRTGYFPELPESTRVSLFL